jgi:hypothetical protein
MSAYKVRSPLTVPEGGTGAQSFTDHGVILGSGTGALSVTAVGTATHVLTSNGAGSDPTFQAAPTTNMEFQVLSSDPGSPTDGQVWYRSDTDAFRGRANGATVTFTVS